MLSCLIGGTHHGQADYDRLCRGTLSYLLPRLQTPNEDGRYLEHKQNHSVHRLWDYIMGVISTGNL
jgi:hypothetical protein